MDSQEFLDRVREKSGVESTDEAEGVAEAALATLGERISGGQAADLAVYLPGEFAGALVDAEEEAESYSPAEFVERAASRLEADPREARTAVEAALSTLGDVVDERAYEDAVRQLPDEYGALFGGTEE